MYSRIGKSTLTQYLMHQSKTMEGKRKRGKSRKRSKENTMLDSHVRVFTSFFTNIQLTLYFWWLQGRYARVAFAHFWLFGLNLQQLMDLKLNVVLTVNGKYVHFWKWTKLAKGLAITILISLENSTAY